MATSTLSIPSPPRFAHGRLLMTPGVRALIEQTRLDVLPYLHRHLQGDWGDLCDADRRATMQRSAMVTAFSPLTQ